MNDVANTQDGTKKNRKWVIFGGLVILIAVLIAGGIALQSGGSERQWQDAMDRGRQYLAAMDFSRAEAEFLSAIEIDPRRGAPYLELANIYIEWEDFVAALAILEQGIEAVPEAERGVLEQRRDEVLEIIEEQLREETTEDDVITEVVVEEPVEELLNPYELYREILSRNYEDFLYGTFSVENLYYAFHDTNGSGIPELFIAREFQGMFFIIGAFTWQDDQVHELFEWDVLRFVISVFDDGIFEVFRVMNFPYDMFYSFYELPVGGTSVVLIDSVWQNANHDPGAPGEMINTWFRGAGTGQEISEGEYFEIVRGFSGRDPIDHNVSGEPPVAGNAIALEWNRL